NAIRDLHSAHQWRIRKDDGEFFAAISRGKISFATSRPNRFSTRSDNRVAAGVSKLVIHGFQIIQIDHDQRKSSLVTLRTPQLDCECCLENPMVCQASQEVRPRTLLHLLEQLCIPQRICRGARHYLEKSDVRLVGSRHPLWSTNLDQAQNRRV